MSLAASASLLLGPRRHRDRTPTRRVVGTGRVLTRFGLARHSALDETGRSSLNRADWLELCNHCHIYYDGVHRPLAAPRSERELEAHTPAAWSPVGGSWRAAELIPVN
jgi:hypothetical protein